MPFDNKAYMRTYRKEEYAELKRLSICVQCRKNKAFDGHVSCPECIEKDNNRHARRREIMTDADKESRREYARQWTQKHKEQGLCIKCSRPAKYGAFCYYHKIESIRYSKARSELRKQDDKPNVIEIRKANGLCLRCGKPIEGNHGTWCDDCAEKQRIVFIRTAETHKWRDDDKLVFLPAEQRKLVCGY